MNLNHNSAYNNEIRDWIEKNIKYTEYLSKQELKIRDCPVCGSANHYLVVILEKK